MKSNTHPSPNETPSPSTSTAHNNTILRPPGRKRFSWRALTSICVAVSFLAMAASGVGLFLAPSTRVARDIDWQMWGTAKVGWLDIHLVFSVLFLVVAVIHTAFNWRPMLNYFKARAAERGGMRWEWVAALAFGAVVLVGTRQELPPFSWLLELRGTFHGGHGNQRARSTPPSGDPTAHGQRGFGQMTLVQYCTKQGLDLDAALSQLQVAGIHARGTETLRQLADEHGYDRPSDIPALLKP